MVEDKKADKKGDGQTSRKEIEIHCGLVAAFNFLDDDGAQEQRKSDAPRQKVEIHGGGLVTAFDFLNDDGANDKGDGDASR